MGERPVASPQSAVTGEEGYLAYIRKFWQQIESQGVKLPKSLPDMGATSAQETGAEFQAIGTAESTNPENPTDLGGAMNPEDSLF